MPHCQRHRRAGKQQCTCISQQSKLAAATAQVACCVQLLPSPTSASQQDRVVCICCVSYNTLHIMLQVARLLTRLAGGPHTGGQAPHCTAAIPGIYSCCVSQLQLLCQQQLCINRRTMLQVACLLTRLAGGPHTGGQAAHCAAACAAGEGGGPG